MKRTPVSASAPVDLHLHTAHSDGRWQSADLFAYLKKHGFAIVAVTDHDTCTGISEMQAVGTSVGVHVLAGVEMSANWHGKPCHILCYANQFRGDALEAVGKTVVSRQFQNTLAVHRELLNRGMMFPRQSESLAHQQGRLVRPIDNATLLVHHNYVNSMSEALEWIRDCGYVMETVPVSDVVLEAHQDGAVAVIAHPGREDGEVRRYEPLELESLARECALDGIEVWYPAHTVEQVAEFERIADTLRLFKSAGSDSHGPQQRLPIPYSAGNIARLLAQCGVMV